MTTATDPLREAFRRRALGAVERMARESPPEALVTALAAATDVGTLARATADQAASEASRRLDPLAGAIARGAEIKAHLAEQAGGLLSAEAVGRMLGITRAAVDKRRATGKALAVRVRSDWHYPACQFRDGEVIAGVPEVLASMGDATGWSVLAFLLAEEDALGGRTPLAALCAGDLTAVRRIFAAREVDAFA
jgi:hypothetical protein